MDQRQASLNIIPVSDTVESPRVRVQRPGTEITIGEGFRPSSVADDHRGIASDRKPIRDRKAADDGLGQVADQRDARFAIATVREDEPCRRANTKDFPERVADQVINRAVLQLEDGGRERPARGSQRTRRRRGRGIHPEKQAAPGRGTPWRLLSSPLPRSRLPRPPLDAWSRLRVLPPWPPASAVHPTPDVRESEQRFSASLGSGSFVLSQPQPLLPREHSINPSLLIRPPWIKGRESLSQLPEPRLLADSIINKEPLQGIGLALSK